MAISWKLYDLIDFEEILQRKDQPQLDADATKILKTSSHDSPQTSESEKRSLGLYHWYNHVKNKTDTEAATKLVFALKLLTVILSLAGFCLGFVLINGLIEQVTIEGKGINIWKFLTFTLGVQTLFLIISIFSWLLFNRKREKLAFFEQIIAAIAKKMAGSKGAKVVNQVTQAGNSYSGIMSWRIAKITQLAAIFFNLGLLVGLATSLFFLEIGFFWSSTIENISRPQLLSLTEFLSLPWKGFYPEAVITEQALELTQLQIGRLNPEGKPQFWYPFLFCIIAFWGLLPRVLLYGFSCFSEARSLKKLTFMERRHRNLWRSLTHVSSEIKHDTAADEVIIISVGGIEATTEEIRPFLLQQLRVSPLKRFETDVLEGEESVTAIEAIKLSKKGVVLLVEGWNLSPKYIQNLHLKIREQMPKLPISYLVFGTIKEGRYYSPEASEFNQWKETIAMLADPEAEAISYNPTNVHG